MCGSTHPTPQDNPKLGPARGKLLDPEKNAVGPGGAAGAAHQPENDMVTSKEQQRSPMQPLACFKTMSWLHWGRGRGQSAASCLARSSKTALQESWQSAVGQQAGEDWHRQPCCILGRTGTEAGKLGKTAFENI